VPLRTALRELNTLRAEYADAYNRKDASALTAMYLSDAVVIRGDGTTLLGLAAIGQALGKDAASWKRISLSSDTTRVYGNTAWDVGTMTNGNEPAVSRYLAVLRRGVQEWKISSLAVVPMASAAASR
jgi:ketosteroid isomerase-like protein